VIPCTKHTFDSEINVLAHQLWNNGKLNGGDGN